MSKCKYCDSELIYIKTRNGGQMPCEARLSEVWRTINGKKDGNDGKRRNIQMRDRADTVSRQRIGVYTALGELSRGKSGEAQGVNAILKYPIEFEHQIKME